MFYHENFQQFMKMLKNLNHFFDKAQAFATAKKIEPEVLLNSRLAPDQFALTKQIQIACDTAKLAAARLTGKDAPAHADQEKTLPEVKERIQQTIQYLETFKAADFNNVDDKKITQPRWDGKYLSGQEYFVQHVLPNFYFHVTTAYAILRHNGVDLGKKDYLGELPFKK